jgi:aminomethyltransferase
VGKVTFSARGHTVGKLLALAYVNVAHAWPGSRLLVQVGERHVPAVVTPTPFFDPQGARLRAKA